WHARADLQHRRVPAAQAFERSEGGEDRDLLRAQHRLDRGGKAKRRGKPELFLDAPGHGEPEMRVAVDEPGEHRLAPPLYALGARPRAIDFRGGADASGAI